MLRLLPLAAPTLLPACTALLACTALSCATASSSGDTAAGLDKGERITVPFAWPVPGRAKVVEDVEKQGVKATLNYDVEVRKRDDGNIGVALTNMSFASIAGDAVDTPAEQEQAKALLAQLGALPDLVVSPEGKFVKVDGMERLIDTVLQMGGEQDPDARARAEAMMRDPRVVAAVEERIGDIWRSWSESFVALPLSAAGAVEKEEGGTRTTKLVRVTPTEVEAILTLAIDPAAMKAAIGAQMQAAVQAAGKDPSTLPAIDEAHLDSTVRATLDRKTGRPLKVERREVTKVSIGGKRDERAESHAYTFTWSP